MSTLSWYGQPEVGMFNPLVHWLWVPFCTIFWIPLRGLSWSWGIGFRIPLRGLFSFRVPPGLVVPEKSRQREDNMCYVHQKLVSEHHSQIIHPERDCVT